MIKLLIVDDELATREGLMQIVPWRKLGVDMVRDAADGLEALQVCAAFRPDIVLTDVKMPGMDGIQLGVKLRESYPGTILLFLSSYADKAYLKSAISLSALDYIEKPVNMEELGLHIRRAVALAADAHSRRAKESELETVLSEGLVLLKEKLALQLIGKHEPDHTPAKLLAATGKSVPSGAGIATVVVTLHGASEAALNRLQAAKNPLLEELERRLAPYEVEAICGFKDNRHLIVHLYARWLSDSRQLLNIAAKLRTVLQETAGEPLFAFTGIGSVVYGTDRVLESYHTAVVSTQRQFFLGYNQAVAYEELDSRKHAGTLADSRLDLFSRLLEDGQEEDASRFIMELAGELRTRIDTLVNHVKNFFFELLLRLYKEAANKGIPLADEAAGDDYIWNVIFRFQTLQELSTYMQEKIGFFFRQLRQKENAGAISFGIRKLVHRHYADVNLSIKTLSDALFLTPNYLSLQFKKETGLTINQYITDYRMERAKELLKDRKRKLYDVASSVGFQDANYFAKSFKKSTGLTPSEFKEKYS